jgi:hypothetical protein
MSVPEDKMMELMRSQRAGGKTAPPAPPSPVEAAMSDASTGPMSSPMSTPEPKLGNREGAMINLSMAMDLIEQALPSIGSESPEGQRLISALSSLTRIVGPKKGKTNELQTNEILQMLQTLPKAGGATPESMAMAAGMPIPGTPPPPPPPPSATPPGAPGGAPPMGGGGPVPPTPPSM